MHESCLLLANVPASLKYIVINHIHPPSHKHSSLKGPLSLSTCFRYHTSFYIHISSTCHQLIYHISTPTPHNISFLCSYTAYMPFAYLLYTFYIPFTYLFCTFYIPFMVHGFIPYTFSSGRLPPGPVVQVPRGAQSRSGSGAAPRGCGPRSPRARGPRRRCRRRCWTATRTQNVSVQPGSKNHIVNNYNHHCLQIQSRPWVDEG